MQLHREKKDEERKEMEKEAVIDIMAGVLKVDTFPVTTKNLKKACFSSAFLFHHFCSAQIRYCH
jgi:hypothetical protein